MEQEFADTFCELGYICQNKSLQECNSTILKKCQFCSKSRVAVVCFFFALIGLVGLLLNGIVVASVLTLEKTIRTSFAYFKLSLALTDMLWGLFIFLVIIPNIAFTLNTTRYDFEVFVSNSVSTWQAIISTMFLYMCITSSVYHLSFFAVERVISLKFKYWFRNYGKSFNCKGLIVVWILSITIPSLQVIFDIYTSELGPKYVASRFVYDTTASGFVFYFEVIVLAGIPLSVMTIFTVYTGVLVGKNNRISDHLNSDVQLRFNRQRSIFRTLTVLEIAFIVGLIPLLVYYATLESLRKTSCYSLSSFSITAFFIASANSIVDPLIYSFRDEEFRASCKIMLKNVQQTSSSTSS